VIDSGEKHLEVVVDDSQLSLAIGKKGQNVRLAAKLLGWKIDIKSEEEKRQEVEQQMAAMAPQATTPLESVPGLGEGLVEKLSAAGITTVEALADMTPEQLEAIEGIGPKTVEKISLAVNNYFASLDAGTQEGVAVAEGEAVADESSATDVVEPAAEETAETAAEDAKATASEPETSPDEAQEHEPEGSAPETTK
jgi:N utilization substance protein A